MKGYVSLSLMKGADKMLDYKNPEGYSDPTPYHALADKGKKYMPLVYICSPFSGDVENNIVRARGYSRLAVDRGAIPIAPHLLFPQFMSEETERELVMFMDIAVLSHCKELWVFGEPTAGMKQEIAYAERKQMTIKYFKEDT